MVRAEPIYDGLATSISGAFGKADADHLQTLVAGLVELSAAFNAAADKTSGPAD